MPQLNLARQVMLQPADNFIDATCMCRTSVMLKGWRTSRPLSEAKAIEITGSWPYNSCNILGNTAHFANLKATAYQCQHEEGRANSHKFILPYMLRLVSFTNGTLRDPLTKMAPYRWPRYYKGECSTVLLIVMFEYIIMPTRFYTKGDLMRELDSLII